MVTLHNKCALKVNRILTHIPSFSTIKQRGHGHRGIEIYTWKAGVCLMICEGHLYALTGQLKKFSLEMVFASLS